MDRGLSSRVGTQALDMFARTAKPSRLATRQKTPMLLSSLLANLSSRKLIEVV